MSHYGLCKSLVLLFHNLIVQDKVGIGAGLLSLACLFIKSCLDVVTDFPIAFLKISLLFGDNIVNLLGILGYLSFLMNGSFVLVLLPVNHLLEKPLLCFLVGFLYLLVYQLFFFLHFLTILLFQRYTNALNSELGLLVQSLRWMILAHKQILEQPTPLIWL